jgi:hypothetical protein
MCKNKKCTMNGCSGCQWTCNCEYNCFACSDGRKYGCSSWRFDPDFPFSDVRNKYVCFPCKRIWKSSITKYQVLNPDPICNKSRYIHNKQNRNTLTEEELQKIPDMSESKYYDFLDAYYKKHSKCSKCSCDGLLVGRNFRHCKNDKEWIDLQKRVNNNEIDLYNDFYDYPRELNK